MFNLKKLQVMKTTEKRISISAKAAEEILENEGLELIDVFETGLGNDYDSAGNSEFHSESREEMENLLLEKTKWSIFIDETGNAFIDWMNDISGFGTGYWGHDPVKIENSIIE